MSTTPENSKFQQFTLARVDPNKPTTLLGYYLGLVGSGPAYERPDLGAILRAIVITDEGELFYDFPSGQTARVTTVVPPLRVQVTVHPKVGKRNLISYGFSLDPLNKAHFDAVCEKGMIIWDGSAAKVWGDPHSIDVAPGSFADIKRFLDAGYDAPSAPKDKKVFVASRATAALAASNASPAPQLPEGPTTAPAGKTGKR